MRPLPRETIFQSLSQDIERRIQRTVAVRREPLLFTSTFANTRNVLSRGENLLVLNERAQMIFAKQKQLNLFLSFR